MMPKQPIEFDIDASPHGGQGPEQEEAQGPETGRFLTQFDDYFV